MRPDDVMSRHEPNHRRPGNPKRSQDDEASESTRLPPQPGAAVDRVLSTRARPVNDDIPLGAPTGHAPNQATYAGHRGLGLPHWLPGHPGRRSPPDASRPRAGRYR